MPPTSAAPQQTPGSRYPGPKRSGSAPVGPEAVREAVLEAAARLFAERGVDRVSLRDIAHAADVQLPLIRRYVGRRAELVDDVFQRLNDQVAAYVETHPLEQLEYGRDSPLGRWLAMSTHYALSGQVPPMGGTSPVDSLAEVFEQSFGIDHQTARLRAAQVTAISMGWRLFESYLTAAPELDAIGLDGLRDDLNAIQRQIGSTPWPTPLSAARRG